MGHLGAVDFALDAVDRLWLGIGSSNKSREDCNPFSASERQEMIIRSLGTARSSRVRVFQIPDVNDHRIWIKSIEDMVPHFETVFTTDQLTADLYASQSIKVVRVALKDRGRLSGTNVRRLIASGGPWESLVPEGTRRVLLRLGVSARPDLFKL